MTARRCEAGHCGLDSGGFKRALHPGGVTRTHSGRKAAPRAGRQLAQAPRVFWRVLAAWNRSWTSWLRAACGALQGCRALRSGCVLPCPTCLDTRCRADGPLAGARAGAAGRPGRAQRATGHSTAHSRAEHAGDSSEHRGQNEAVVGGRRIRRRSCRRCKRRRCAAASGSACARPLWRAAVARSSQARPRPRRAQV
jgi:hypothetical protein